MITIDFRRIFESARFNPLAAPYELFKTGDPVKKQLAMEMVDELAYTLYPVHDKADPFWPESARSLFVAAVYALFEYADADQVNMASVYQLVAKGEGRMGPSNYLKSFVDILPSDSIASMLLQSYVNTASDTKAGIRSTFLEGLSMFARSEGLIEMLSGDDLHINSLRGDRKTAIYIIIPDETPIFDKLCGVLCSQLMSHYIRVAEDTHGGRLPVRHNFVIEELGNVGSALRNLPHMLSAGRSRNVCLIVGCQQRTAKRNGNPPRSPICSPMRDISETAVIRKPTAARLCPSSNPRTVARKICTTPPAPTLPSWKKTCLRKSRCFSKKEKNNSPKPRHKISTLFRAAFDVPNAALSIAGKFAAEVSNGSVPGTKKTSRLVTRTTTAKNEGEAPMWLVENSHPAIVTREIFNKAQEESARRKAKAPVSQKSAMTASGKYSKYALTEVMICGECGSRYKRVTWNIRGKRRIVWRCISRLDYGKKYCTESITVDEQALQRAIVRALNRFNVEDEATYLLLMKSTIGEAVGINGSSDEIDLLERRIDALNKRMLDLVSLSVQEGDDAENHEDDFKNISTQIEQLTKRITAIRESESENGDFQARLKEIQDIIDKRRENKDIYDDSIVRQMVECIKVYHDGRLQIILGGGYELEEYLEK